MLTAGLGVAAFIFVILALVIILLGARSKLVNTQDVKIIINGDESNPIIAPAGATLLNTLSAQKIFIPSACGGKGSCGVCKVNVLDGGGSMLPTEVSHINRGEAREGCRLACRSRSSARVRTSRCAYAPKIWRCVT
jgi:Na+-transporting NADH:ubiquinone oxidoreductase subunit F